MLTSPIEPSLDPSLRVLSLPLTALYEAPVPIGALAGLPAGMLDIASANLLIAATPCDPPLFGMKMEDACTRFGRDVMLVRTGLFPETMNPVTVDVALVGPDGPFTMTDLVFMRRRDDSLWLPTLVGQRPDSECRGKRSRDQMPSGMWMVPMATDPAFQTPFL